MTITRNFSILANGAGSANTLSLGGATLGSNALAVTGSSLFPGSTTITSAGLVGIGMTPSNILDITQNQNARSRISLLNNNASSGAFCDMVLSNGTSGLDLACLGTGFTTSGLLRQDGGFIGHGGAGGLTITTQAAQPIYFGINSSEVARIDANGYLLLGYTTSQGSMKLQVNGLVWTGSYFYTTNGNGLIDQSYGVTTVYGVQGYTSTTYCYAEAHGSGGVQLSSGATSWTSLSDETMKTDLVPITGGLEKVVSLRAVTGRYKSDDLGIRRSFLIAQDVQKVLPEAVTIVADDSNSELPYEKINKWSGLLSLSYTETMPLFVSAFKDVKTSLDVINDRVTALEVENASLKDTVTALELNPPTTPYNPPA